MSIIRRLIHPHVRVISERDGTVEYIASDETLDSYNEVIKADGWRFDEFQKNAPFVDSHNYGSIDCLLGRVIDFQVKGTQLLETVKWAIDVPSNELAQLGFQMTAAGYLKAVSVGFIPVRAVSKFDGDPKGWTDALKAIGMSESDGVRCIYLEQQQKELSACVIGANSNALARSYSDGILTDARVNSIAKQHPEFAERMTKALDPARRRSFSFLPSQPMPVSKHTMKTEFLDSFKKATGHLKAAHENLEFARRGQSEGDLIRATRGVAMADSLLRREMLADPLARYLDDNERRAQWHAVAKRAMGLPMTPEENAVFKSLTGAVSDGIGSALTPVPIPSSPELLSLILVYGAFKTLGVRPMPSGKTRFAKLTALPDAYFIMPQGQGGTIPEAISLAGEQLDQEANSVASRVVASLALMDDGKTELSYALLEAFTQGLAARIDWGCFQADGTADTTDGGQTGIFASADVASVDAAPGNTKVEQLQRADLLAPTTKVAPSVLQRGGRYWFSPSVLPQLMLLKDGNQFLIKTPLETETEEWSCCGFPMTLTAAAPSDNSAGKKIGAFGYGPAYLVGLREEFELTSSPGRSFVNASREIRAITRARLDLREKTGFATLKLAAA